MARLADTRRSALRGVEDTASAADPLGFALRKRLLRAKKYWALVSAFGDSVLGMAPLVCVSRLDSVPLASLAL